MNGTNNSCSMLGGVTLPPGSSALHPGQTPIHRCVTVDSVRSTADWSSPHSIGPVLSIVIVSTGTFEDLDRALMLTRAAVGEHGVEVVAVRADTIADRILPVGFDLRGAEFVRAPADADRPSLSELAMKNVSGDIVAIREDINVREAGWVAQYLQVVRQAEFYQSSHPLSALGDRQSPGPADLPAVASERRPRFPREIRPEPSSARVAL